jgi:oligopeptide transport system permease protein
MMTAAAPEPLPPAEEAREKEPGTSLWRDAWLRLRRNHLAVFGGAVVILLSVACALGPWVAQSYRDQKLELGASPPLVTVVDVFAADKMTGPESSTWISRMRRYDEFQGDPAAEDYFARLDRGEDVVFDNLVYRRSQERHWLGTDTHGRDLLARILYGGRISLAVGLCATFVSLTIGVTWGAIAGFFGGALDAVMMRIVDILYALPFTIFVILLKVFSDAFAEKYRLGPGWNLLILFAAIGAVEWLTMARIVRGQIMALRRQEFIEAAFSLGLTTQRIIFRHMVPNVLGPIIVYATLTIPAVMLLEAFLSFLGLGVNAPMSSWGVLINDGVLTMEEFPWLLIFPGAFFSLTLFSLNFLGDGLRDALDVRASKD